jgi:hypothetical protein
MKTPINSLEVDFDGLKRLGKEFLDALPAANVIEANEGFKCFSLAFFRGEFKNPSEELQARILLQIISKKLLKRKPNSWKASEAVKNQHSELELKLQTKTVTIIDVSDWDDFVKETYQRPYSFQQQDGCKERGIFEFSVPDEACDYENDTVPEIVNCQVMGVSFAAWLARDPEQILPGEQKFYLWLWWDRNFYPDIQMIANDLHARGLLDAGKYTINIDW